MTVDARTGPRVFRHLDALTDPIEKARLREFRDRMKQVWTRRRTGARSAEFALGIAMRCFLILVVVIGPLITAFFLCLFAGMYGDWTAVATMAVVALAIGVGGGIPLVRWAIRKTRGEWMRFGSWRRWYRLDRVGDANNLAYMPEARSGPQPGTMFKIFPDGTFTDVFASGLQPAFTFGNYEPSNMESQRVAREGWGFLQLQLETAVPNLLLVPRGKATLALAPKLDQRLSLEGDFDRYFTLYAPRQYERDALYVITPDLMALLIDELPGAHVEIIDRQLVIFMPQPWDFLSPATWWTLTRLLATVGAKTLRQTTRYVDARHDIPGTVAPAGRRLRLGIPILTFMVLAIALVQVLLRIVF